MLFLKSLDNYTSFSAAGSDFVSWQNSPGTLPLFLEYSGYLDDTLLPPHLNAALGRSVVPGDAFACLPAWRSLPGLILSPAFWTAAGVSKRRF